MYKFSVAVTVTSRSGEKLQAWAEGESPFFWPTVKRRNGQLIWQGKCPRSCIYAAHREAVEYARNE